MSSYLVANPTEALRIFSHLCSFRSSCHSLDLAAIKNKYAQTLVLLFRRQYPQAWPTFFTDFFALLQQGALLVDMVRAPALF